MRLGTHHTAEAKRKMSKMAKGRTPWMKGREHTAVSRRKISAAGKGNKHMLGKCHSPESKHKMSESHRGQVPWNKNKKMGPLSEETKRKMSDAHKGLPRSKEHRRNLSRALKGRKVSEGHRHKLSEATKRAWANGQFDKCNFNPPGTDYNGIQMRSSWEARLAQAFDKLGWAWEYEAHKFQYVLGDSKHTYVPDFYLPHLGCYFDPHHCHWGERYKGKFNAVREQCGISLIVLSEPLLKMYECMAGLR